MSTDTITPAAPSILDRLNAGEYPEELDYRIHPRYPIIYAESEEGTTYVLDKLDRWMIHHTGPCISSVHFIPPLAPGVYQAFQKASARGETMELMPKKASEIISEHMGSLLLTKPSLPLDDLDLSILDMSAEYVPKETALYRNLKDLRNRLS